jgi:hypothetical protein
MDYILENIDGDPKQFTLDYPSLRDTYRELCALSDEQFMGRLVEALHFAVIACFFKGVPGYVALSDVGVIHELVHLLSPGTRPDAERNLATIRRCFAVVCELA